MDVTSLLYENSACMCAVAIVATILALAVSTRYSLRHLFNIRTLSGDEAASESSEVRSKDDLCDATGNEGDDEAEGEDDNEELQAGKPISPRYPDPVEYCEHIQGEIKRVQQTVAARSIEKALTDEQIQEEREVQRKQLQNIFTLMQTQHERFGMNSMDDMQEQMKLYAV